jgi:hypothetical protein
MAGPILTSPADGALNQAQPITFTWEAYSGATRYHIQVALEDTFADLIINTSTTETSYQTDILDPTTEYFWRVRAMLL